MKRSETEKTAVNKPIWDYLQKGVPPMLLALFPLIASCYLPPSGTPISEPKQPPAGEIKPPPAAVKPPPAPVYFYPKSGQSPEQQDRDRYECYNWAKQQTGFDPVNLPPGLRAAVVPARGGVPGAAPGTAKQGDKYYSSEDQVLYNQLERAGMNFRRAMSACLEGRGYSVR